MQDRDYTITDVQEREPWTSGYGGQMRSYAIQLQGVEGWLELAQRAETPSPLVGATIHGYTEATQRGSNTYLKFKKVNPNFPPNPPQHSSTASQLLGDAKTTEYMVQMLEELTGRKKKPDALPTEEDMGTPFDLDEIPF